MKTIQIFNVAKIFSLALVVFFSACSEAEDPMPVDPNQADTTGGGLPGVPTGGGNPGGGLPGGGGGTTGGGSGDNPGNGGNGPLGGGGQQPTDDNSVVGMLSAGGSTYEFTGLTQEAEGQLNEQGGYPIYLGYYDEASTADDNFELFDSGNTALFIYNARQAGVVEPGNYSLDNSPFGILFFGIQGYGYVLNDGNITVETTQSDGVLLISVSGNVVEVAEVDGQLSIVSEETIPVEAQFGALAQVDANARRAAGMDVATQKFSFELLSE